MNTVIDKNNEMNINLDKLFKTNVKDVQSLINTAKQAIIYDILNDINDISKCQLDKAKLASTRYAISLDTRDMLQEQKHEQLIYSNGILEGISLVQNLILKQYNK